MKSKYLNDINSIKKSFSEIIIDESIYSEDDIISWKNYASGISKKLYAKEYESLKDNRQYSLLLSNRGFVQFYYQFAGDVLEKVKLAYYPYPVQLKESNDELEEYLSDTDDSLISEYYYDLWNLFQAELGKNIDDDDMNTLKPILEKIGQNQTDILEAVFNNKYHLTNTSHIRMDYDAKVTSHDKFEIQYSSINSLRIPLKKIISPFLFMDFIARCEFSTWYEKNKQKPSYIETYKLALSHSMEVEKFLHHNVYGSHD